MARAVIHIDGSSLGNPGESGAGFWVADQNGRVICRRGIYIGHATNNQAEYRALIEALRWLREKQEDFPEAEIRTDSELLYKQIKGLYRVKDPELARLAESARALMARVKAELVWVERGRNRLADTLARQSARTKEDISHEEK